VNISIRITHALFNAHFPGEPGLAGCPCEVLGLARSFCGPDVRMSFLTSASRNTLDALHFSASAIRLLAGKGRQQCPRF